MRFLNFDGSKKFPFSVQSLTRDGVRELIREVDALRKAGVQFSRFRPRDKVGQEPQEVRESKPTAAGTQSLDTEAERPILTGASTAADSILNRLRRDPEADLTLYYVRFRWNDRSFYKIGVTTNDLRKRFGDDYFKIDKILFEERVIGALSIEKEIKSRFKSRLFPLAILRDGSGFTEFFDVDVLELDKIDTRAASENSAESSRRANRR